MTAATEPRLVSVNKIWDRAPHNAFTDLIRFRSRWWCTFREAEAHGASVGRIRILVSDDGAGWESAAEVAEDGIDLRDPKLSVMPDGRLLLVTGGSLHEHGSYRTRSPRAFFSADGCRWSEPTRFLAEDHWLWRVTWHGELGYGVSKLGEGSDPRRGFLYATRDAVHWRWITELRPPEEQWTVSETTLRFMPDGALIALIRPYWIGTARPPYADWSFSRLEASLGGPNFIRLADGALWAASRWHDDAGLPRTALARMTRKGLEPALLLPSGGDCSYPGMVWHDGLLWMSYYSSHEAKTSIYLAKVDLGGEDQDAAAG